VPGYSREPRVSPCINRVMPVLVGLPPFSFHRRSGNSGHSRPDRNWTKKRLYHYADTMDHQQSGWYDETTLRDQQFRAR
jgi:hypothetical protein